MTKARQGVFPRRSKRTFCDEEPIFPVPKARGDLDVGLASYAGDAVYLAAVDDALRRGHGSPEVIVYVAGSDSYEVDLLGTLQVSRSALLARKLAVRWSRCRRKGRADGLASRSLPHGSFSVSGFRFPVDQFSSGAFGCGHQPAP